MKELTEKERLDRNGHILRSYDWDYSEGWQGRLASKLTPIIQELYVDLEGLERNLEDLGLDNKKIKQFIEKSLKATIPSVSTDKRPENFQVRRADFAELLSLICLEGLHNTNVPVKNLFFRELTHAASRGVDILGYEYAGGNISLIICEVKGSKDKSSPPSVVHGTEDSMKAQLYSYVSDRQKTLNRILDVHKKTTPEHKEILFKIALWWSQGNASALKVVVCPFLVRQAEYYKSDDFGFFKDEPDHFNPAQVRFLIVCIHDDIVELSNMIYKEASKAK